MKFEDFVVGFTITFAWLTALLLVEATFKLFFGFELLFSQKLLVATILTIAPFGIGKLVEK